MQEGCVEDSATSVGISTDTPAAFHTNQVYPQNNVVSIQLHRRLFSLHQSWHYECSPLVKEKNNA